MALFVGCVVLLGGCHLFPQGKLARSNKFKSADDAAHYQTVAREIEYPKSDTPENPDVANTLPPRTLLNPGDLQYWDLSLEDAFRIALANNTVIRDVGGRVVTAPAATATPLDPAIIESDPRSGVEAALSAFDAQLDLSTVWNKDDRVFNSSITQSFTGSQSDRALGQIEVNKITASGTQVAVRNVTDYAQFESFFNRFDSYYNTIVETEIRHPFLQGGGLDFNRIAGPNAVPGAYNGVVLARINTDISLADFESAIIGLTQNVEQTYWALYAAYRDLDARIAARNNALQTWRSTYRRLQVGAGDAEEESAAREQFWAFQGQVDNALSGSTNVSAGFLTPTQGGILAREAQFRQLLGLTPNDGRLIRPADEPSTVTMVWDWDECLQEAIVRRVELRRQRWVVKHREMELIAAQNFLLPRLDAVANYRWFGYGNDLLGNNSEPFGSAWNTLAGGDFQEWQLGFQYSLPIGKRLGNVAVRNAQLQVARDKAILREQEHVIVHQLSDAVAQIDRTYQISRDHYNRLEAARRNLAEVQRKYEVGWGIVTLDRLLEAMRRSAEAEVAYYRSVVDYNLAIINMYSSRGALLDYSQVYLAEGPWPAKAYRDARSRAARRLPRINYCLVQPCYVSRGPYAQFEYSEPSVAQLPATVVQQSAMLPIAVLPEHSLDQLLDASEPQNDITFDSPEHTFLR